MQWLDREAGFRRIDRLGEEGEDFFFLISYDRSRIYAEALDRLPPGLLYRLDDWQNYTPRPVAPSRTFRARPLSFDRYRKAIERVQEEIRAGNTYLLNRTFSTPVECNRDLEEIFHAAHAPCKLHIPGLFSCFSPERFIRIEKGIVRTFPMKGTIDASLPDAARQILADGKETAEHVMITDLMRNDLNRIATGTRVERFRYIERIRAGERELLQVSSEIRARFPRNWRSRLGALLFEITPAGSGTGTPKRKTVEIIDEIETHDRGFYTGVFGVCRGEELRSAVLIRYIEKQEEGLIYKSGGGITLQSDPYREYREMIDKIYLPL
jgi:para-aminobenzoate synthetase component 1